MKPLLLFLSLAVFLPFLAEGAGIEVAPSQLSWVGERERDYEAVLLVSNPDSAAQTFEVSADQNPQAFDFTPRHFLLEPGKSQTVAVRYRPLESPLAEGYISVIAKALGATSGFTAGSGVKVRFQYVPQQGEQNPVWLVALLVLGGALSVILISLYLHGREKV